MRFSRMIHLSVFVSGMLTLLLSSALLAADSSDEPSKSPTKPKQKGAIKEPKKSKRSAPALSPEAEKATLDFIEANNSKVLRVLENLREKRPADYQKAIGEFHAAATAIQRFKEKDPQRYELELKAWKLKSESELLAARIRRAAQSKGKDADTAARNKLEGELKELLSEQLDLQVDIQSLQRGRLNSRVKKMDEVIARLKEDRETMVESRFRRLVQRPMAKNKKDASQSVKAEKKRPEPVSSGP